jgi:hypothetical protein
MAFPEQSLAAWPLVYNVVLFTRSLGIAAQEVVIALADVPGSSAPLRRFVLNVALGSAVLLALIAFTPVADIYLLDLTGVTEELAAFVTPGLQTALLIPGLTALQSWLRALLMKGEATTPIYQAMALNLAATVIVVIVGIVLDAPGIQMASVAMTIAMVFELLLLAWWSQRLTPNLAANA